MPTLTAATARETCRRARFDRLVKLEFQALGIANEIDRRWSTAIAVRNEYYRRARRARAGRLQDANPKFRELFEAAATLCSRAQVAWTRWETIETARRRLGTRYDFTPA